MRKLLLALLLLCTTAQAANTGYYLPPNFASLVFSFPLSYSASTQSIGISGASVYAVPANQIDWAILYYNGGAYSKSISTGTTFTFANVKAGQTIVVFVKDTNTSTVTWPSTIFWTGGGSGGANAPTQTSSATDVYTFIAYDSTHIVGSVIPNFGALF